MLKIDKGINTNRTKFTGIITGFTRVYANV